jgi:hypothetical protein
MYVAIAHQVKDAQAFLSQGERLTDPSTAPPGVVPRQFCPDKDLSVTTCVWEAGSVEAVRDYVDSTLGDARNNRYFEINPVTHSAYPSPQARGPRSTGY